MTKNIELSDTLDNMQDAIVALNTLVCLLDSSQDDNYGSIHYLIKPILIAQEKAMEQLWMTAARLK